MECILTVTLDKASTLLESGTFIVWNDRRNPDRFIALPKSDVIGLNSVNELDIGFESSGLNLLFGGDWHLFNKNDIEDFQEALRIKALGVPPHSIVSPEWAISCFMDGSADILFDKWMIDHFIRLDEKQDVSYYTDSPYSKSFDTMYGGHCHWVKMSTDDMKSVLQRHGYVPSKWDAIEERVQLMEDVGCSLASIFSDASDSDRHFIAPTPRTDPLIVDRIFGGDWRRWHQAN
jgi:hypothetical protein